MGYMYYDWTWFVIMIPCLLLSLFCSAKVKTTFSKYSKIPNSRGMTGAQAADALLRANGVTGVVIERVAGNLTDHFDPRTNTIRLSESVYGSTSVAAVGVACHEAGHACQHAEGYFPNKLRSAILPVANIGTKLGWILVIIGLLLPTRYDFVVTIGIILYSAAVLFTVVTLPVEFNASSRALKTIKANHFLTEEEYPGASRTLRAAAMTYVAAAATAILQLLRLVLIATNRRR
ncbi:MAG: zinc metallopeptidase [Ruminococcus sp.]|nr:zinc metallopeptidase [Ruminococcus sp.]